jgi:5-methylcytosine-specific restriction endonuclease McrA
MTYKEKLRDPRWQKKRLEIFERDGWQCQSCGSKENSLQVHHLIYAQRDPWEYDDHVYQTLCETCHEERQQITDRLVDAIKIAIAKVPTQRLQIVAQRICSEAMMEIEVES